MEDKYKTTISQLISAQDFMSLPSVTMKILNLLDDDDKLDIRQLTRVTETDSSLSLKLLRIANSPLFAIPSEITSVHQAILTIGLNRVSNIVVAISIFSNFMLSSNQQIKEFVERYHIHTVSTGTVARSFAKRLGLNFNEQEFTAGLLHDIGKLAMLQYNYDWYKHIVQLEEERMMTDVEAEKLVFGFTHLDVGEAIAELWYLPRALSDVIKYHANFRETPAETKTLVAIVSMANILCDVWGFGFYEGMRSVEFAQLPEWKHLLDVANKKDIDLEEITFNTEQDYKLSKDFIRIMKS